MIISFIIIVSYYSEKFTKIYSDHVILQTSDGYSMYHDMVNILRPIQEEYAKKHGWSYVYTTGILYGSSPIHSIFNRYFLIKDLIDNHPSINWILYMDADSYFVDLEKNWKMELDSNFLVIACAGSAETLKPWDFNNGIFFFNARHQKAHSFLNNYINQLKMKYPLDYLYSNKSWVCDQQIMQELFKRKKYKNFLKIYDKNQHNYFNYEGPHIQQMLRKQNTNKERLLKARKIIDLFNQNKLSLLIR